MRRAFIQAMENDLDTPAALVVLDQMVDSILAGAEAGQDVSEAQEILRDLSYVFGLRLDAEEPEVRVLEGWGRHLERFT
jgi:cysteinyl-tRNA synthetase